MLLNRPYASTDARQPDSASAPVRAHAAEAVPGLGAAVAVATATWRQVAPDLRHGR